MELNAIKVEVNIDAKNSLSWFIRTVKDAFGAAPPLQAMTGPVSLVASNLIALKEGTRVSIGQQVIQAAPLFKIDEEGHLLPTHSGYPVTGTLDSFGQMEVATALAKAKKDIRIVFDRDFESIRESDMVVFGSPSSNLVSGRAYAGIKSLLEKHLSWGTGWGSISIKNRIYSAGPDAVVLSSRSPFNTQRRIIVISGIGALGTLSGARFISTWNVDSLPAELRTKKDWVAVVSGSTEQASFGEPALRDYALL